MSREELILMAQICEKAERFDDMMEFMKKVTQMDQEMSEEERDLLSMAFKEAIGVRRRSWRVVCNIEKKEDENKNRFINLIRDYKDRIEKEVVRIAEEMLTALDSKLIPSSQGVNHEAHQCFLKLKGDFHRYIAEISVGDIYNRSIEKAMQSYDSALDVVTPLYSPAHPARLSLELNRTVMMYEIMNDDERAINYSKSLLTEGLKDLDTLGEDDAAEARIILKLIKDNLTLWTTDPKLFKADTTQPDLKNRKDTKNF